MFFCNLKLSCVRSNLSCALYFSQGHCVVVLMAMLEQMTPRHYQQLRLSLMDTTNNTNSVDLQEFILCTFNAFCELVALNLYSNDWTVLKLQLN